MVAVKLIADVDAGSKTCKICSRGFNSFHNTQVYCGACELWDECAHCKIEFKIKSRESIVLRSLDSDYFCSRSCFFSYHASRKSGPIECETHGYQLRSASGRCAKCHNEESMIAIPNWIADCKCELHLDEVRRVFLAESYECWSCIKELKLDVQYSRVDEFHPGQEWLPTFRHGTRSRRGQHAMEQILIERSIGWFVYIKFYIDSLGDLQPLVIGKTGSKLVNATGTDISFRYEGEYPARVFLRETELSWDSSKVLIISTETESEALEVEEKLAKRFSLLYS